MKLSKRMDRERDTIKAMIDIYCHGNHGSDTICQECSSLMEYVTLRLDHCPFKENKPTCVNCTVHCYASDTKNPNQKCNAVFRTSNDFEASDKDDIPFVGRVQI